MGGSRERWVVLTVFLGTFMAPLDASIVNLALPAITDHFGVPIHRVEWVVTAYLLTTSSLLLTAGRLSDMAGHRRIYLAGFALFTAASVLCGMAGSLEVLVASRVLQALGGTLLLSSGPAILTDAVEPRHRGRALGTISVAVAIGLTAGPFLGGFILQSLSWRLIFWVNLPVGISVILLGWRTLPVGLREPGRRFDLPGAGLAVLFLLSLLVALNRGSSWGWASPPTLSLLTLACMSLAAFLAVEGRRADPMLDLSLFRQRIFAAANFTALANYVGMYGITFLTPFLLLKVFGYPKQLAGLVLTAVPVLIGLVAPVSGSLSDRMGSRILSTLGMGVTAAALLGLSFFPPSGSLAHMGIWLALAGLGSGLFQSPNTSAIMGAVPPTRRGIASGMQATMRNMGMALGVALAGAVLSTHAPGGAADPGLPEAIRAGYRAAALVTLLGVASSLLRGTGDVAAGGPATPPGRPGP